MTQTEVDSIRVIITEPTSVKVGRGMIDYSAGEHRVKGSVYDKLKAKGVLENEGEQVQEPDQVQASDTDE